MKKDAPYGCDSEGCTEVRGPNNGWFMVQTKNDGSLMISGWDQSRADESNVRHFCGAAHVMKEISSKVSDIKH